MHTAPEDILFPHAARQSVIAQPQLAMLLSIILALLALIASAGGLFWDGLYRDNTLVTAAFRGNDLITLVVAVPWLVAALTFARRGSAWAALDGIAGLHAL